MSRIGAILAILTVGCGSGVSSTQPPAARQRDDLAKQLASMSPDQRAEYIRQHPEAMSTLSGTASPNPQP